MITVNVQLVSSVPEASRSVATTVLVPIGNRPPEGVEVWTFAPGHVLENVGVSKKARPPLGSIVEPTRLVVMQVIVDPRSVQACTSKGPISQAGPTGRGSPR